MNLRGYAENVVLMPSCLFKSWRSCESEMVAKSGSWCNLRSERERAKLLRKTGRAKWAESLFVIIAFILFLYWTLAT